MLCPSLSHKSLQEDKRIPPPIQYMKTQFSSGMAYLWVQTIQLRCHFINKTKVLSHLGTVQHWGFHRVCVWCTLSKLLTDLEILSIHRDAAFLGEGSLGLEAWQFSLWVPLSCGAYSSLSTIVSYWCLLKMMLHYDLNWCWFDCLQHPNSETQQEHTLKMVEQAIWSRKTSQGQRRQGVPALEVWLLEIVLLSLSAGFISWVCFSGVLEIS